jgi:hypothetical protein
MGVVSVLDTGVLIGITIENDAHHDECYGHLQNRDECIVTPIVESEYSKVSTQIRTKISDELTQHRQKVSTEVDQGELSTSTIGWIRSSLLDRDMRCSEFLDQYYDVKQNESRYDQVYKLSIVGDLEDMEMGVWDDTTPSGETIESLCTFYNNTIPQYPDIKSELLIHEGDDPDVCIEAHHIATEYVDDNTELATTNPVHFIRQVGLEPETREENILRVTNIHQIEDVSCT